MTTEQAPVAVGDVLADKLAVERILGRGGMGIVVAARHLHLQERVAVKLLLPEISTNEEFTERFLREAQAAVRIKSEHVARVMDVGKLADGVPYIVMEYLEGQDLESMLARGGPMPVEQAVDFIVQACDAIAEAHAAGIVHRDLKPSNLFHTQRPDGSPHIKVLDFGISKNVSGLAASAEQGALTKTGGLMGSPLYMSPEQVRSTKRVDTRTDIWSLGVILYELLVGNPPFAGENVGGLLATILEDEPVPVVQQRADVPPALALVIHQSLEKDPANRPQTIADFVSSLSAFGSEAGKLIAARIQRFHAPHSAPAVVVLQLPDDGGRPSHDAATLAQTAVAVPQRDSTQSSRRMVWVSTVAVAVLIAGAVGVVLARSSGPSGRPEETIVPVATTEAASSAAEVLSVALLEPPPMMPTAQVDAAVPAVAASRSAGRARGARADNAKKPEPKTPPTTTNTSKGGLDGLIDERR